MKSAYATLGVPGNASIEDIVAAFKKAQLHYSHQRLADDPALTDKLTDVQNAYKVLRDPEQRAAHDRKLASLAVPATPRRRLAPIEVESSRPNLLVIACVVIVLMVGIGTLIQQRRENQRLEEASRDAERARQVAEAEARARAEEAELATAKAKLAAEAERNQRTYQRETEQAIQRANSSQSQREYSENQRRQQAVYDARRVESEARADEQRKAYEAQRRLAADKALIRELCYQNYRRPDC